MPTVKPHFFGRTGKALLSWIGLGGAEAKMRAAAEHWLESADKVWHFRRDLLPERDAAELRSRTEELRSRYREHAEPGRLTQAIEALEPVLKRTGGGIFPKTMLVENVEFFLVAAIVIIGVRTYFVQPFKIPTNSMWPSYYGMTPDVYVHPGDSPGMLKQAARFVLFGARHHEMVAPESGPITVHVGIGRFADGDGKLLYTSKPGRSWFIFPTTYREYTIYVNTTPVAVQVPADFDGFDQVVQQTFGITAAQLEKAAENSPHRGYNDGWVTLDRPVLQGQAIVSFDEVTGDQLFVDRLSYHFVRPQVGQGFVFATGNIPGIATVFGDQYYIKRLIGTPGDTIEVRPPVLWRNGAPITGADAFDKNARQQAPYRGYVYGPTEGRAPESPMRGRFLTGPGESVTVPAGNYFAMGDNSNNSFDGRYWGFVPAKEVVGRPLFIYFPLSRRWGPAR